MVAVSQRCDVSPSEKNQDTDEREEQPTFTPHNVKQCIRRALVRKRQDFARAFAGMAGTLPLN
jgi:hypothetical protein